MFELVPMPLLFFDRTIFHRKVLVRNAACSGFNLGNNPHEVAVFRLVVKRPQVITDCASLCVTAGWHLPLVPPTCCSSPQLLVQHWNTAWSGCEQSSKVRGGKQGSLGPRATHVQMCVTKQTTQSPWAQPREAAGPLPAARAKWENK